MGSGETKDEAESAAREPQPSVQREKAGTSNIAYQTTPKAGGSSLALFVYFWSSLKIARFLDKAGSGREK